MTVETTQIAPRRPAALTFMGIFAAVALGLLVWLTVGAVPAVLSSVVVLAAAVSTAAAAPPGVARSVLILLTVVLVASLTVLGYGTARLLGALAGSGGPADRPNTSALASADAKLDASVNASSFHLELTEGELTAVLQEALLRSDHPLRSLTVDIVNAVGNPGRVAFTGTFKSDVTMEGLLSAEVTGGRIELDILELEAGMFQLPGAAHGAVEDLIADVADLEDAVADEGVDVQSIVIGDDRLVVTGINLDRDPIDPDRVLAALGEAIDPELQPIDLTPRYPAGRVGGTHADGPTYYVALGDSLAAAVGAESGEFGYVSKFHGLLEAATGRELGLRNLSVVGESSGSMLAGDQLTAALAFAADNDVEVVTINIGANDLLGHLGSGVCSDDIEAPTCEQRIEASLGAYARNIEDLFDQLEAGFPDATVVVLTTYNPFSFGFGEEVAFEVASDAAVSRLNDIASVAALSRGFVVADGQGPLRATATLTTHMSSSPPDIHPNELGYDVLTSALDAAVLGP